MSPPNPLWFLGRTFRRISGCLNFQSCSQTNVAMRGNLRLTRSRRWMDNYSYRILPLFEFFGTKAFEPARVPGTGTGHTINRLRRDRQPADLFSGDV